MERVSQAHNINTVKSMRKMRIWTQKQSPFPNVQVQILEIKKIVQQVEREQKEPRHQSVGPSHHCFLESAITLKFIESGFCAIVACITFAAS